MQGGPPPFVVCPRCTTVFLGGRGYCPRCGWGIGIDAYLKPTEYPSAPTRTPTIDAAKWFAARRQNTSWRRTRGGLVVTAVGLLLVWIPWISFVGALLISLGSSLMFLGARASGRGHRVAVALAFLAFAIGAVIIVFLLGAFLLRAYQIARIDVMSALRPDASLLQWGTLPGTAAIALGLALQVHFLLPLRERTVLYGLTVLLVVTAYLATALAEPELVALSDTVVSTGAVLDFLSRLSLYRIVEAPAYLGLAVVYLFTYRMSLANTVAVAPAPLPSAP